MTKALASAIRMASRNLQADLSAIQKLAAAYNSMMNSFVVDR
jgi:hypothetical protein